MENKWFNLILPVLATILLFSCEKYNGDDEAAENKEANSILKIRTRATADGMEGAEISYPINIYVFNSSDKCVEKTVIGTADEQIALKLPEGSYSVFAIAGADAVSYILPEKADATPETPISLISGKSHADLMTARNNVTLSYGEENTLTLSLVRKVMLLETVTINDVPDNVTAVAVEISPLYRNILLNGGYSDEKDGAQSINLTKTTGGTWTNAVNAYMLEAAGPATIKVSFTASSGVKKSYSYASSDEFKANHKINISGTYKDNGLTLSGTIVGATWGEPINITFSFDESGSSTEGGTGNGDATGGEVSGSAPAVGTIYNKCYVLKSERVSGGTLVTLMSTGYKDRLIFTDGDQESIRSAVEAGIAELAVDVEGCTGWRLPTLAEMEYIKENVYEIGDNLTNNHYPNLFSTGYYYFLTGDNRISTYCPKDGNINAEPYSNHGNSILRAFTTVTFAD